MKILNLGNEPNESIISSNDSKLSEYYSSDENKAKLAKKVLEVQAESLKELDEIIEKYEAFINTICDYKIAKVFNIKDGLCVGYEMIFDTIKGYINNDEKLKNIDPEGFDEIRKEVFISLINLSINDNNRKDHDTDDI